MSAQTPVPGTSYLNVVRTTNSVNIQEIVDLLASQLQEIINKALFHITPSIDPPPSHVTMSHFNKISYEAIDKSRQFRYC